jgi:hypothetical protein
MISQRDVIIVMGKVQVLRLRKIYVLKTFNHRYLKVEGLKDCLF